MIGILAAQEVSRSLEVPPMFQPLRIESALFIGGLQRTTPIMGVGILCGYEHIVDLATFMPDFQQRSTLVVFVVLFYGRPPLEWEVTIISGGASRKNSR